MNVLHRLLPVSTDELLKSTYLIEHVLKELAFTSYGSKAAYLVVNGSLLVYMALLGTMHAP